MDSSFEDIEGLVEDARKQLDLLQKSDAKQAKVAVAYRKMLLSIKKLCDSERKAVTVRQKSIVAVPKSKKAKKDDKPKKAKKAKKDDSDDEPLAKPKLKRETTVVSDSE